MEQWQHASRALSEIQTAVGRVGSDPDAIITLVTDRVLDVIEHAEGATIEFVEGEHFVLRAASGLARGDPGLRVRMRGSFSGLCASLRTTQVCADIEADDRVDRAAHETVGLRSMIVVPILLESESVGVLKVLARKPEAFDARDVLLAELITASIAFGLISANAERTRRVLEATFEQAAVGICHVDPTGRFLRVNRRFCDISSYTAEQLLAGGFQQITHPDDLNADLEQFDALIRGEIASYAMEKRYLRPDASIVWINLTVSLVRFPDGKPDFFVGVIEDISARKSAEQLAMFDPLTGLPSRRRLVEALDQFCVRQNSSGEPSCVAFLDLDNFKSINDRLGHQEGDRCLVVVADALRSVTRASDLLCRYGGDEFVILMPNCAEDQVKQALIRLHNAVNRVAKAEGWEVGLSIGAVPLAPGASATAAAVLERADGAMYAAKRSPSSAIVLDCDSDPSSSLRIPRAALRLVHDERFR